MTKRTVEPEEKPDQVQITRRAFVKAGGALVVTVALPARRLVGAAENSAALEEAPEGAPTTLDATWVASWLELRSDGTILARTGRTETGTGMSGYYAQAIAEELRVRPEVISLVLGDTDRTPDGGYSAGFLTGMENVRKVAAYTHQALLELAAKQLEVPAASLRVVDGVVSGNGKSVSYGELVKGQQLELKIPVKGELPQPDATKWVGMTTLDGITVTGEPALKPVMEFQVIGTSHPMPGTPDKVTGKTKWSCDVSLPGMLHGRMVRPATMGSTLISPGALDKKKFPTAELVKKGNLVAVVSPNEWEAIRASEAVAAGTKWTEWAGLPGSENVTKAIRAYQWEKADQTSGKADETKQALSKAPQAISASYEQGYTRHAPIGPFVAVADVREDRSTTVWTHSAQSQGLRARIAFMLGVPTEKVVVRWLEHSGQYGRTTFGGDGAETDAVILSQMTGKPVRVQWTLQEDLVWSSVSPAWVSDFKASVDAKGYLSAVQSAFYSPHMTDPRPVGALLAGMPAVTSKPGGFVATEWPYDKIQRLEEAYGMPNVGAETASGGLRGNIMRTPGQRQQCFALEGFMNEAAARAGMDPIEYRIAHTSDQRLIEILRATAKAAGWEPGKSPRESARQSRSAGLTGRGVCIIVRSNAYWAGIAVVNVTPATGAVQVTKFTIGCEPGKVINPRQLERCLKSGVVMGLSEALKEEVTFDRSKVTSTNWSRYKILTMQEMPEIQVVTMSRDDKGFGGGSEAANAVVPAAVAAALFDATGVWARRIPLTAGYVKELLKA
jgi:Aerobic-type carbon monoxide dehydrogenase, large subunit CoxL/CutL homologs